ncbi:MAG TPA: DUF4124 domain-containing protein, partial [Xanthomonadaceae bacterium]|nr:DUF4124 domain-containing protein [Xanthomonadaceae bacterium]
SIVLSIVAIGLLAGSSALAGDPVYKWKDANGQSHYSQQAPEGVKYETISTSGVSTSNSTATAAPGASAAQPGASGGTPGQAARQKSCEAAQKNVEMFTNSAAVSMDVNGDGKPVALTPGQQAEQLTLAKQQAVIFCSK